MPLASGLLHSHAPTPFSPSLISLMVSVDVKYHVYFLKVLMFTKQAVARALMLSINKQAVVNPLNAPVRKFPGLKTANRHTRKQHI